MRRIVAFLTIIFGLVLVVTAYYNVILINQARQTLQVARRVVTDSPERRRHLAVLAPDRGDSFNRQMVDRIKDQAEREDAAVQVFWYPFSQPESALSHALRVVDSRLDGLIYLPGDIEDPFAIRTIFETSGPPLVILTERSPGMAFDLQEIGRQAVVWFQERLDDDLVLGLVLSGQWDEEAAHPLYQGVEGALGSGDRIGAAVSVPYGELSGEESVATMLRDHSGINVLICGSDRLTEGAAQIFIELGLVGQVHLLGLDQNDETQRLLERGVIDGLFVRNTSALARQALQILLTDADDQVMRGSGFTLVASPGRKP